jgi:hypothetical protein
VQGTVEVDGRALTGGEVFFHPEVQKPGTRFEMVGMIGSDGLYTMTTNGKPGVPPGKYKVSIMPPLSPEGTSDTGKLFNSKFESANETPLTVEVTNAPNPGQYDLQLTR